VLFSHIGVLLGFRWIGSGLLVPKLQRLSNMGISYSSLAYPKRFIVDKLKIDQSSGAMRAIFRRAASTHEQNCRYRM
jgi:hypothetical protein